MDNTTDNGASETGDTPAYPFTMWCEEMSNRYVTCAATSKEGDFVESSWLFVVWVIECRAKRDYGCMEGLLKRDASTMCIVNELFAKRLRMRFNNLRNNLYSLCGDVSVVIWILNYQVMLISVRQWDCTLFDVSSL